MNGQIKFSAAFLILILAPLAALARDFSGDSMTQDASGRTLRGKIYRASNMIRAESATPSSSAAEPMIVIVDVEKQVSYTISNRQKMIMLAHGRGALNKIGIAYPVGVSPCTPASGPALQNASCKQLGEETVNGRHTTKWELTETLNGHSGIQYVWFDAKLRTAIKVQMGPVTLELENIQEGPQPASLFAIPTGYRQMDVGGR